MKLHSLGYLGRHTLDAFRRFPWVLTMAFTATGLSIWLAGSPDSHSNARDLLFHFLLAAYLGISLLFGITMFLERTILPKAARLSIFLATWGLLAWYAYSMQSQPEAVVTARYALFILASHLFAAVAPFLRGGHPRGFWEYNHRLFIRILVAALFSTCLYLGLAAALAAVEYLFKDPIPHKAHFWLWALVSGVFNTWFFLAGLPEDFQDLENDHPYPRVLKILTQFILIPLVSLYLVILYAYAVKVVATWTWPIGWVSYMILICALLGILCLLLTHPIREREENKWIKAFARAFIYALFPLMLLLFTAIGKRISEYRITENRYFVVAMACWLTGIALYFTFSRVRNIKIVPVSLGLLALFASFGPWGAFQVSSHSQIHRLQGILAANHLLAQGKLAPSPTPVDFKTQASIGSILNYLQGKKALGHLRPWLPDSALAEANAILANPARLTELMRMKYVSDSRYGYPQSDEFHNYEVRKKELQRISGFDFFLDEYETMAGPYRAMVAPDPNRCEVEFAPQTALMRVTLKGRFLLELDLNPMIDSLKQAYPENWNNRIPPGIMYLERQAQGYSVGLQVRKLILNRNEKAPVMLVASVYVRLPVAESGPPVGSLSSPEEPLPGKYAPGAFASPGPGSSAQSQ